VNNINQQLNNLMSEYLKRTGHYKTGSLARSISFNARITNSGEVDLGFKANEYILYLDDGKFVDNFFALPTTKSAISNWIVENITS
jgi:hypothetical protein